MSALSLLLLVAAGAGEPVWSTSVKVEQGGSKSWHAKGVKQGQWYELVSKGSCTRRERARNKKWREKISGDETPQVMGVDFKVTVGGLEPVSVDHQERTTRFKADRDDPEVKLEDQSTAQSGIRCTVTELAIRRAQ